MQRGRKSSSSNIVPLRSTPARSRLIAPSGLTVAEKAIFIQTAGHNPHLKPGDATILAVFAQASVRSSKLAKRDDTKAWEQTTRTMLALARALRLTPISSVRGDSLGRKRERELSYYDQMKLQGDNSDDAE